MPQGAQYSGVRTLAGKSCNTWTSPPPSVDVIYLEVSSNAPVAIQMTSNGECCFFLMCLSSSFY
jgi:hypothetical protein